MCCQDIVAIHSKTQAAAFFRHIYNQRSQVRIRQQNLGIRVASAACCRLSRHIEATQSDDAAEPEQPHAACRDGDVLSSSVQDAGQWEAGLATAMLAVLNGAAAAAATAGHTAPVFLDIGANLGAFTLAIAAAGHRVIAIEPLAANTVALRRSLCRNGELAQRVLLFDKALSGDTGRECVIVSGVENKVRLSRPQVTSRHFAELLRFDPCIAKATPLVNEKLFRACWHLGHALCGNPRLNGTACGVHQCLLTSYPHSVRLPSLAEDCALHYKAREKEKRMQRTRWTRSHGQQGSPTCYPLSHVWYVAEADAGAIKRWCLTSPLAVMLRGHMIQQCVTAAERWRAGMQRARWLAPSPGCHAERPHILMTCGERRAMARWRATSLLGGARPPATL